MTAVLSPPPPSAPPRLSSSSSDAGQDYELIDTNAAVDDVGAAAEVVSDEDAIAKKANELVKLLDDHDKTIGKVNEAKYGIETKKLIKYAVCIVILACYPRMEPAILNGLATARDFACSYTFIHRDELTRRDEQITRLSTMKCTQVSPKVASTTHQQGKGLSKIVEDAKKASSREGRTRYVTLTVPAGSHLGFALDRGFVTGIRKGSVAERADLRRGDQIIAFYTVQANNEAKLAYFVNYRREDLEDQRDARIIEVIGHLRRGTFRVEVVANIESLEKQEARERAELIPRSACAKVHHL